MFKFIMNLFRAKKNDRVATSELSHRDAAVYYTLACNAGKVWCLAKRANGMNTPLVATSPTFKALLLFGDPQKANDYREKIDLDEGWEAIQMNEGKLMRCLSAVDGDGVTHALINRDAKTYKFEALMLIRETLAIGQAVFALPEGEA